MVAIAGSGGKSTVLRELAAEAKALDLAEEALSLTEVERIPDGATLVLWVAGLDALDDGTFGSPMQMASYLADRRQQPRTIYILNKTDDELRLQQARQVAALLLPERTLATVDGQLVWPQDEDRDELGR